MKILITTATYYPNTDGVQNVTQYQAEGLAMLGHDVTVVTSNHKGEYNSNEIINNVRIVRMDAYNKNMYHYGNKRAFQQLVLELSQEVDVLLGICLESFSVDWLLPIIEKMKCPCYIMDHGMHDFRWHKSDFLSINECLKKILRDIRWGVFYKQNWKKIKKFNGIAFLHEKDYAYEVFKRKHCNNLHIIYNAAAPIFFELENVKKCHRIINVGSYNSRKNQLLCLECFYKAKTLDYELVIIGNPKNDYYNELNKKKNELEKIYGEKNVSILCNLDRVTTIDYIRESRIYLLTSTWEAFPISIIEAMASAAAFVSTDVGIMKYLPGGIVAKSKTELIAGLEEIIMDTAGNYSKEGFQFAKENFQQGAQVKRLESMLKGY